MTVHYEPMKIPDGLDEFIEFMFEPEQPARVLDNVFVQCRGGCRVEGLAWRRNGKNEPPPLWTGLRAAGCCEALHPELYVCTRNQCRDNLVNFLLCVHPGATHVMVRVFDPLPSLPMRGNISRSGEFELVEIAS